MIFLVNYLSRQAKHAGTEGPIGLIPSQELEERRKAFVPPEADFVHKIGICGTRISKRKTKIFYKSKSNCDFDKADMTLYEEVTRMPPFKRKTLVLVGVQGVGRRTLKNRLINSDIKKFGGVMPRKLKKIIKIRRNLNLIFFRHKSTAACIRGERKGLLVH